MTVVRMEDERKNISYRNIVKTYKTSKGLALFRSGSQLPSWSLFPLGSFKSQLSLNNEKSPDDVILVSAKLEKKSVQVSSDLSFAQRHSKD